MLLCWDSHTYPTNFSHHFFLVCFVNENTSCTFVEYKGRSLTSGNCQKTLLNIIFKPLKGKMFAFNVCSFRSMPMNILQPTIDISSIIKWLMFVQLVNDNFILCELIDLIIERPKSVNELPNHLLTF